MLSETHGGTNLSIMIERHRAGHATIYYGCVIIREDDDQGRTAMIKFAIRNRPRPSKKHNCWLTTFGYHCEGFARLNNQMPDEVKRLMAFMNRYVDEARRRHDESMLRRAADAYTPTELFAMAFKQADPCPGVSSSHMWPLDMDDPQLEQLKELAFMTRPVPQTDKHSK